MTKEKLLELADAYDQILGKQHVSAANKAGSDGQNPSTRLMDSTSSRLAWKADNLSHAKWMCGEVKKLAETDVAKANRWFGFIQAIMWTMGIFTIAEMRGHNA